MKILRIKIIDIPHRPLLNGLELSFADDQDINSIDPNCLIGVNGSGKSQLLETIAEIFYYLDKLYRKVNRTIVSNAPCLFEIDYYVVRNETKYFVQVIQTVKKGKAPELSFHDEDFEEVDVLLDGIEAFLPNRIIAYTSGENETLSIPFLDYYDEYAAHTANRANSSNTARSLNSKNFKNEDYEPRFYFMDYNTNRGVVIANLTLGDRGLIDPLLSLVSIESLISFQVIFQTKHSAAKGKDGIKLTEEHQDCVDFLKRSCTSYDYSSQINRYVFDFYVNEATIRAFTHFFKTSLNFYTAIYKLELLNNLIIDKKYRTEIKKLRIKRRQLVKPPSVPDQDKVLHFSEIKVRLKTGEIVDYINLSDGEHQFLNIFGTIAMIDEENSVFLLDEPDTHFNPKWRREFISKWNGITKGRKQDNFITSHSPFIVSDCKRYKVFIFRKNRENKLEVFLPQKETYGASFDFILQSAFDLDNTLSEKSFEEIKVLLKSKDLGEIEAKIADFGESAEKFYLQKRIEEIKLNSKNNAS